MNIKLKKIHTIGILFLIFLFSSCGKLDQIEIIDFDNIIIKGFKDNAILFVADVKINNPSNYKINIKELDLKISMDGKYLGHLLNDEKIIIASNAEDRQSIAFKLKLSNILTGASIFTKYLSEKKEFKLETAGYIKVRSILFTKKIQIEETMDVKL